jgi:threonine/homoserine/homoserine lactone efflux protein
MDTLTLLALLGAAAINAAIPGPSMAFTASRAAAGGLAAGLRVTLGALVAKLVVLALVWGAVAGAITLSSDVLAGLRHTGIAALCLLAVALWRVPAGPAALPTRPSLAGPLGDVAGGFAANASSPVNLVFLLALLPQVVDPRTTSAADLAVLAAGLLAITAAPLVVVSAVAARAVGRAPRGSVRLARLGALALILFAGLAAAAPG